MPKPKSSKFPGRLKTELHARAATPRQGGAGAQLIVDYRRRVRLLRQELKRADVSTLAVTRPADVRYLCGFTGSDAVLAITATRAVLFVDGRFIQQSREEVDGARVVVAKKHVVPEFCAWLRSIGAESCSFDASSTTVAELDRLRSQFRSRSRRKQFFRGLNAPLVPDLRMIKDREELARVQAAAEMGSQLFSRILPYLRSGIPETEIAGRLEWEARLLGAEGMSFETIVASGLRSSMPHARATASALPRRGFVTLDFGVILSGYCSDMTRTIYLGKASRRERQAYEAVLSAQRAAIAQVKPGVPCGAVDEAARSVLREAGLAQHFTHSTGHGVGLEIHEGPRVAAQEKQLLAEGMVITIEPGVYVPGEFGIRIEDMVAVTGDGARVLTTAPSDWNANP